MIILFICISIIIFFCIRKRNMKNMNSGLEEGRKEASWKRIFMNILLSIFLLYFLFLLFLLSPTQWAAPTQFDSDAVDVIRVIALGEFCISVILAYLNRKKKAAWGLLLIANIFTIYKVIGTFIIF